MKRSQSDRGERGERGEGRREKGGEARGGERAPDHSGLHLVGVVLVPL